MKSHSFTSVYMGDCFSVLTGHYNLLAVIKDILILAVTFTLINILVAQDMTGSRNYGLH